MTNSAFAVSGTNSPWVLLSGQQVTNGSQMVATNLGSTHYLSYWIVIGVIADTAGQDLYLQTSTNNGSTFDTSNDYSYVLQSTPGSTGTMATANSASSGHILVATDLISINMDAYSHSFTNSAGYNFSIWGNAAQAKFSAATFNLNQLMGYNSVSTNINAFRLIMSSGTISGYLYVYGLLPAI